MMCWKKFRRFVKTLVSRHWLHLLLRSLEHRLCLTFLWARDTKWLPKKPRIFFCGKYGATVKPFNEEVQKKCIGDAEPITCRPADLLDNEMDKLEKESSSSTKKQDEDVLSYALFPQVATDFFKYRQAQEKKIDEKVADTENGAYPV